MGSLTEAVLLNHPEAKVRSAKLAAQLVVTTLEVLTHRWVVDNAGARLPKAQLRRELIEMVATYLGA